MTTLGFYGGVGSVTGANFLLDTGTTKLIIDCGLIQGSAEAATRNAAPFGYDPASVDLLLVTHAHADHIGRIPKLIKDGFCGPIHSTTPTKTLAGIMLHDAHKVMTMQTHHDQTPVLYEPEHIDAALAQWQTVDYATPITHDDLTIVFTDAGHILGSGMVQITRGEKKIVFTGDIGNVPQPLLNPPIVPTNYDYLVMESVYGDRQHEEVAERTALLKKAIIDTQQRGGTLIIPAFSLERTQGMLLEINNLVEQGEIKPLPVFLDSPLAIAVTDVYRQFPHYLKQSVQEQIAAGDDIFSFPGLSFTPRVGDSKEIDEVSGPKIIIAGSGMSHGGRIRRHEQRYLGEATTTVLLVGYQSVGSLGRLLHDGATRVKIDGKWIKVKARVTRIQGYSGHADRNQLLDFVATGGDRAKQIFVTMGEEAASLFLVQRIRDYLGRTAVAPTEGEVVEIDF